MFYFFSISAISQRLLYFLEHLEPTTYAKEIHYDAVIVLTGMVHLSISEPDHLEFSSAVDRILRGIELVNTGQTDYLVISGGNGSLTQNDRSESVMLRAFAQKLGVSPQTILIDSTSQNTYQNAVNTAEILKLHNLKRVVLVTSAFHMVRATGCFKKVGIHADLLPVDFNASVKREDFRAFIPSSTALQQSQLFLHETAGIIAYVLAGRASLF